MCVAMQRRGGFGGSCSFVVAISARFGLLQVFIAAAEQPMLCSAAGVDRTFCTSSICLKVCPGLASVPYVSPSGAIHLCGVLSVCVQMAGCDHYSPVL